MFLLYNVSTVSKRVDIQMVLFLCPVLAEDAIQAALKDYKLKQDKN